jgi:hypothetical protein
MMTKEQFDKNVRSYFALPCGSKVDKIEFLGDDQIKIGVSFIITEAQFEELRTDWED